MPDDKAPENSPAAEKHSPSSERPAPPPFNPDLELIGYIERGQKSA
jgi:hypothetical protein